MYLQIIDIGSGKAAKKIVQRAFLYNLKNTPRTFFTNCMRKSVIELSLELFNSVPKGTAPSSFDQQLLKYGVILDKHALHCQEVILDYFKRNKLTAEHLNQTFHKSWKVIEKKSRWELFIHQVLHYMTTYGSDFTSDYVYLPAEELDIPEVNKIPLKVIRGLDDSQLIEKALALFNTGIALEETTIDKALQLLYELGYQFKTVDDIRNKEALVKIIAHTGIYPSQPTEFLRYLVYLHTKSTLLIKNDETIEAIKESRLEVDEAIEDFGLARCSEIFYRFKPLWLSFKANDVNTRIINQMSRLARKYHKPLVADVLNSVTSTVYTEGEIKKALKKVNNFRKLRLLNALNTRMNIANAFLYRIRNGKSFVRSKPDYGDQNYYSMVFDLVYQDLISSLNLAGKSVLYATNVDYGLPSSEKMFVGNIPAGTRVWAKNLVSGVYWKNDWGAKDLDLSGLQLSGKIGWNSDYKSEGLLYSGDITNAPNGATELLYAKNALSGPAMSMLNVFRGEIGCKFKYVIGSASGIKANYMFDPNELILEVETETKSKQQILGLFMPEGNGNISFTIINTGFGNFSVSAGSQTSEQARNALYFQYSNPISFKKMLIDAGTTVVHEGTADIDLRPQSLGKDTLLNLFS